MVIEEQVFVDLPVLCETPQPGGESFHVLQSHPVLIKLFVHSVHVGNDALCLCLQLQVLLLGQIRLLHYLPLDLPVTSSLKTTLVQLFLLISYSIEQFCLLYPVKFIHASKVSVEL